MLHGRIRLPWGPRDIIMFLNKLKIVENTPPPKKNMKKYNKTSMAKATGSFREFIVPSLLSGPRTVVPTEPLFTTSYS